MAKYSGPYRHDFPSECAIELVQLIRNPTEAIAKKQYAIKDWREVSSYALGVTIGDPPDLDQFTGAQAHAEQPVEPNEDQVEDLRDLAAAIQEQLPEEERFAGDFSARGWREIMAFIIKYAPKIMPFLVLFLEDQP